MQLITHLTHLRYLIGFTGSSGFLVHNGKKAWFFTDFRYKAMAQELEKKNQGRMPFAFVEMDEKWPEKLQKIVKNSPEVEFESAHLSVDGLKMWKKRLKGIKLSPTKTPLEALRAQKDAEEIHALKKSQKINEAVLERIKNLFKTGVTELELAWQIKAIGHELGADDISFEPIVAFGPNSAVPHHHNSTRKLKAKDIVLIDMGMKLNGYCSDMTRTFFVGKPTAEQAHVYNTVLAAQLAAEKVLKAGVPCAELDQLARATMGPLAEHFGHSLGHGIGLDVHETPNLSSRSKDILKENMVVTLEPGIYLPGKFGVRIEDMGRVTPTGYENFTKFRKTMV